MLKALRFEILRDIKASCLATIALAEQPVRVATLIDEKAFLADQFLVHNKTVFLEDRTHDWEWRDGLFRYYTRVAERADVLIIYELEEVTPAARFCPQTGGPLVAVSK